MHMSDYSTYTDEELAHLLKQGDRTAFTEIYFRYWELLYKHVSYMLGDAESAMDTTQDIFTDLWLKAGHTHISTSLKAYLYTAARYKTMDAIRRSVLFDKYLQSMVEFSVSTRSNTDETVIFNELTKRIESEVSTLPPRMRRIFELSRIEGFSHKDITEELDITDHTVKKTLNRALKILRSKLTAVLSVTLL